MLLVWQTPPGEVYPDAVRRAAEHALDAAVTRGAVTWYGSWSDTVACRARHVAGVKAALRAHLGEPR